MPATGAAHTSGILVTATPRQRPHPAMPMPLPGLTMCAFRDESLRSGHALPDGDGELPRTIGGFLLHGVGAELPVPEPEQWAGGDEPQLGFRGWERRLWQFPQLHVCAGRQLSGMPDGDGCLWGGYFLPMGGGAGGNGCC